MDGICTLANDKVYDQVVALLNSIEANQGADMPVCIYPYNDNIERITAEIARRPQVQIYSDRQSIERWDQFFKDVWDAHPNAHQRRLEKGFVPYYRFGHHRPFCAFDGPFDRFVYIDADALLMKPVDQILEKLNDNDWVVYDFQYKDIGHVYDVNYPGLNQLFSPEKIKSSIFCSGLYATRKQIFDSPKTEQLLTDLRDGEAEVLYIWAADQPILNYMVMKSGLQVYNLALNLPKAEITGNSITSSHFQEVDHVLYDKGQRLTYLHYIGLSSRIFAKVCAGENIDFPYRDIFLHYRYLHEPDKRPQFKSKPKPYNPSPNLLQRAVNKLKLTLKK